MNIFEKHKTSYITIFFGKLLIGIAIFLALSAVVGEIQKAISTRINVVQDTYGIDSRRTPYPYVMFKGIKNADGNNEGGYNGVYPQKPKADKEFRICVLGGSTVYHGTPSLPEALNEIFQTNGYQNVRVYNFGVVGANSSQELLTLVMELSELQPDLIIQYDGINDLYLPLHDDPRPGYPYNFVVYEMSPLLYPEKFSIWKYVIYKNPIINILGERFFPKQYMDFMLSIATLRQRANYKNDTWKQSIVNIYTNNLIKASTISKAFGSKYIAFFQPTIFNKNQLAAPEQKVFPKDESEYVQEMQNAVVNSMQSETNRMILFKDLRQVFATYTVPVFLDVMHINKKYNKVVAQVMYEALITQFSIPRE